MYYVEICDVADAMHIGWGIFQKEIKHSKKFFCCRICYYYFVYIRVHVYIYMILIIRRD